MVKYFIVKTERRPAGFPILRQCSMPMSLAEAKLFIIEHSDSTDHRFYMVEKEVG